MSGLDLKKQPNYSKEIIKSGLKKRRVSDLLNKDIRLGKKKLADKEKELFYQELSILLSAGLDIKASLELLVSQQKKEFHKTLFQTVTDNIITGNALSYALEITGQFSAYEYFSIRIGEEIGKLTPVLADLAAYFGRRVRQRRQLVQALSYPVVILSTATGAVAFMVAFIIPMFSEVFKRFGGELPFLTRAVLAASGFVQSWAWLAGLCLLMAILVLRLVRKKAWYRHWQAKIILTIPVIGPIVLHVYLARFCNAMALLTGARTPLLQAIKLSRQMVGFYPVEQSLEQVERDILNGGSLYDSIRKFAIYDQRMVVLLKVGEESNKLDMFFGKLAAYYEEDIDHRSALLGSFLEPLIIIFLGGIIAIILLAMYLPMFEISTVI